MFRTEDMKCIVTGVTIERNRPGTDDYQGKNPSPDGKANRILLLPTPNVIEIEI